MISDVDLGSTSTAEIIIPPKTQKQINLTLPISLTRAYTDYNLLKTILFNTTVATFKIKADVRLQPFIAASFVGGFSNRLGAALDGLTYRLRSVEPLSETHVKADIEIEFTNRSPLAVSGVLYASLSSAEERNLQYAAAPIEVFAHPYQHYLAHLAFTLPNKELKTSAWYVLELMFETFGHTYEWRASLRV